MVVKVAVHYCYHAAHIYIKIASELLKILNPYETHCLDCQLLISGAMESMVPQDSDLKQQKNKSS